MTEESAEVKSAKPDWVKMKPAELEKIVVQLGKQGNNPAKIGIILRDKHGIPKAKLLGKRISQILIENNVKFKTEKEAMEAKIKNLESHIATRKHDKGAKRSLTKSLWAIKKLQ